MIFCTNCTQKWLVHCNSRMPQMYRGEHGNTFACEGAAPDTELKKTSSAGTQSLVTFHQGAKKQLSVDLETLPNLNCW